MITTIIHDGITNYHTEYKGVRYNLYFCKILKEWEVHSKRIAMSTIGSFRHFGSLVELEKKIKAFSGISKLIEC